MYVKLKKNYSDNLYLGILNWIVIRTALHDSVQSEVSICKTGQKTSVFRR